MIQEKPGSTQGDTSEADGLNGGVCGLYLDERLTKARARVQDISWRTGAEHSGVRRNFHIKAGA